MAWFRILSLVVVSGIFSIARANPVAPAELSFVKASSAEELSAVQVKDLEKLLNVFLSHGYLGLNPYFGNGEEFFGVDDVLANDDMTEAVFLKLDRRPEKEKDLQKLYISGEGFIYSGKTSTGLHYVAYFIGPKAKVVQEIVAQVEAKLNEGTSSASFENLLLPRLYAGTTTVRHKAVKQPFLENAVSPRESARETFKITLEGIKECAGIILVTKAQVIKEKVWDRTVKVVKGAIDLAGRSIRTLGNFFTGKVKFPTFDQMWASTKNVFSRLTPKQVGGYLNSFLKEKLAFLRANKNKEKKAPGVATRENCKLFAAVATKLEMMAAGFFIPASAGKLAWDAIGYTSKSFRAKEEIRRWLEAPKI